MAFDPKNIRRGIKYKPRKVVIYGPPKIGKSTLVAQATGALMIPTEDRVNHIDCDKTGIVQSYDELMEIFEYLSNQGTYKSIIIDTIDWLEPLIWKKICKEKGFNSLVEDKNKETNFGKGMKYHAVEGWKEFLEKCDLLRDVANINIILVAHAQVEKIDPPESESYDRYNLDIDKHAAAVVFEWADIVGFYNREILVKTEDKGFNQKRGKAINSGDDTRALNLQSTSPAWISGNSYDLEDCIVKIESAQKVMQYILNNPEQKTTKKGVK